MEHMPASPVLMASGAFLAFKLETVISAVTGEATTLVWMAKVATVWPAGMIRVEGTEAELLLLEIVISAPSAGAGAASVMVPVELWPPFTAGGAMANPPICT